MVNFGHMVCRTLHLYALVRTFPRVQHDIQPAGRNGKELIQGHILLVENVKNIHVPFRYADLTENSHR